MLFNSILRLLVKKKHQKLKAYFFLILIYFKIREREREKKDDNGVCFLL